MKFSTRTIDVVEMTAEEYSRLWTDYENWPKHGIEHWLCQDGNNEIRFAGEDFYRPVCLVDKT